MFKKLMSAVLLSALTLSAFAAPDAIEADLAAATARAVKAEEEAKDVLRAAHVRALKSRISANEMAVRRLKTKLAVTKDADAKITIEARIAELTDEVTAMTAETQTKPEITIGEPPVPVAQAQAAAQPAAKANPNAGKFKWLAGVWVYEFKGATYAMVISDAGELLTDANHGAAFVRTGHGMATMTLGGSITTMRLTRVGANQVRFGEIVWRRVSSAIPEPSVLKDKKEWKEIGGTSGVFIDDNHFQGFRDFVKANPVK